MYFDALTTAAMVDELRPLVGGKVQEIVLVDPLSLGMEVYSFSEHERYYLLLSAQAANPRVQLLAEKPRRGPETPLPLLLLLRKYARGARLAEINQPGFERILSFVLATEAGPLTLLAEIMGRRSNLILVNAEGTIMEAIKRVTPEQSRRPVLPQHPYAPPPPLEKMSIATLTPARLRALLVEDEGPLWRRLVEEVAGMSPLLAHEVVFRATGNALAEEAEAADLIAAGRALLVDLPASHAWQPCVGLEEGQVTAYAPYPLTHLAAYEPRPTLSAAIDEVVRVQGTVRPYAVAREIVGKWLAQARERETRRKHGIVSGLRSPEEADRLRESGEWILAYAYQIAPRQDKLVVEGMDGKPLTIALDPHLSPSENAQRYFKDYDNVKAAVQGGPKRLAAVDLALARIDQWETDLQLAENRAEIDDVRVALVEAGYLKSKRRTGMAKPAGPRRIETDEGFVILVGHSSRQNATVLERAAPQDLWFHVHGAPGGHVILVTGGRQAPEELVLRVAALAAYYSSGRGEAKVPVDVTERRFVRPIRGAGPGQVTYREERTVVVEPRDWA